MSEPERVALDAVNNRVVVTVDTGLYPLQVVYGAAYVFIDRCFVLLDVPAADQIGIELRGRQRLDEVGLRTLAGEFSNELLTQVWRQETVKRNSAIIEAVAAQALAGAAGLEGRGNFDELGDVGDIDDLDDDAFDDPLGIAVPWEEKYGKDVTQDAEPATATPPANDMPETKEGDP